MGGATVDRRTTTPSSIGRYPPALRESLRGGAAGGVVVRGTFVGLAVGVTVRGGAIVVRVGLAVGVAVRGTVGGFTVDVAVRATFAGAIVGVAPRTTGMGVAVRWGAGFVGGLAGRGAGSVVRLGVRGTDTGLWVGLAVRIAVGSATGGASVRGMRWLVVKRTMPSGSSVVVGRTGMESVVEAARGASEVRGGGRVEPGGGRSRSSRAERHASLTVLRTSVVFATFSSAARAGA